MKILFVVKEFPHSSVIGGPIIIYNRVKYLSQNHTVSMAAFAYDPTEEQIESVARYTRDLKLVAPPAQPGAAGKARWYLDSPVPPYFMPGYSPRMYSTIRKLVESRDYDVVISEYSLVAQYLFNTPDLSGIHRVMSVHVFTLRV